jgi:uncharacterized protein (DUF58 family)
MASPSRAPQASPAAGKWLSSLWLQLRRLWKSIPAWRRIRFTRGGLMFALGSFGVGFAAFNTGNNLLYLLFGAMLGLIVVSGWLSEQVIRDISVHRRVPRGVTVGNPVRIQYEVRNHRRRMPSLALEVGEDGLSGRGFLSMILPGEREVARSENSFVQRGVFPLRAVRVSTSFPFGLFRKSRDIPLEGELVIWPRSDRRIPSPTTGGGRRASPGAHLAGTSGIRGEYRGLRTYRPGDDPRDIHWRTTARFGHPVVRVYEQSDAESLWICLDLRGKPGDPAEAAVEIAASLAAGAFREGRRFGFFSSSHTVEPGLGPGQLERVLGALARVDFSLEEPPPRPPASPTQCALVSQEIRNYHGFGDYYTVEGWSEARAQ